MHPKYRRILLYLRILGYFSNEELEPKTYKRKSAGFGARLRQKNSKKPENTTVFEDILLFF